MGDNKNSIHVFWSDQNLKLGGERCILLLILIIGDGFMWMMFFFYYFTINIIYYWISTFISRWNLSRIIWSKSSTVSTSSGKGQIQLNQKHQSILWVSSKSSCRCLLREHLGLICCIHLKIRMRKCLQYVYVLKEIKIYFCCQTIFLVWVWVSLVQNIENSPEQWGR